MELRTYYLLWPMATTTDHVAHAGRWICLGFCYENEAHAEAKRILGSSWEFDSSSSCYDRVESGTVRHVVFASSE